LLLAEFGDQLTQHRFRLHTPRTNIRGKQFDFYDHDMYCDLFI
jgi:hypothetical protein